MIVRRLMLAPYIERECITAYVCPMSHTEPPCPHDRRRQPVTKIRPIALDIAGEVITAIYIVTNPDKTRHVAA